MAMMNVPLRGEEKKQFQSLVKGPSAVNRMVNPKEKIGEKSGKTLPIR